METRNYTPFPSLAFLSTAKNGMLFHTVVTRATFQLRSGCVLRPSVKQNGLTMTDEYYGEVNQSSVRKESDLCPVKPGCDVYFVNPTAVAPEGRSAESWQVDVSLGSLRTSLKVTGSRSWSFHPLKGWVLSQPQPTTHVPIRYESAFGGYWTDGDRVGVHRENLVGCGMVPMDQLDRRCNVTAPQIEDPSDPVAELGRSYKTIGLGPITKTWAPRVDRCGTYDDRWLAERWPVPPADFQPTFYQCAPRGLAGDKPLNGNEIARIGGMSSSGEVTFQLPDMRTVLFLRYQDGRMHPFECLLDTVVIDIGAETVDLVWRGYAPPGDIVRVCEIRLLENASRFGRRV